MSLTISIIGHNEDYHLKELLPQLSWADEVIYVDCGSTDTSVEVAKNNKCILFQQKNNSNLNINKTFGINQATSDWIFYLDPDERFSDALQQEILQIIVSDPEFDAYEINRKNHYFGKWVKYGSQYPDTQLRLFKKNRARFENKHVHERLQVDGKIGKLKNDFSHFPYVSISQYFKKFDFYTTFEANKLNEAGKEITAYNNLKFFFLIPFTRVFRRYFLKLGFLDGIAGLFCALFDGANIMVRYFKLWEIKKNERKIK